MTNDIAIAHDQLTTRGGAEQVTWAAARALDAPVYAMVVDDELAPDDVEVYELAGRVGQWAMDRRYLVQDAYQMLAWQHVEPLYEHDVILEMKTNPYWFVPQDHQTVVRYCHSTPRGLYDQFHRDGGLVNRLLTPLQRVLYRPTISTTDKWLVNSDVVQRRLSLYFGAGGEVVYPPVDVEAFGPDTARTEEYLFSVGRLARNKRLDVIVEAAKSLNRRVLIAGTGPERDCLETDAPDNVEWLGYISEREKQRRLSEAAATLMLSENEDFGIVPIESFASGTPVIGVDEGMTRHQIKHLNNGVLCPSDPQPCDVVDAVRALDRGGVNWSPEQIAEFAEQFGAERFRRRLRAAVEDAVADSRVEPELNLPTDASADRSEQPALSDGGTDG
jgi:glycosyltransferase involved in cell wall biosynthesis